MKVKLINVGRAKVNREFEMNAKNLDAAADRILGEVSKHLMSNEVDLEVHKDDPNKATVIVGGFRPVGEIEVIP
jgi:hypothetical protein